MHLRSGVWDVIEQGYINFASHHWMVDSIKIKLESYYWVANSGLRHVNSKPNPGLEFFKPEPRSKKGPGFPNHTQNAVITQVLFFFAYFQTFDFQILISLL